MQRKRASLLIGLPAAIATMHMAWGVGFLWSMIRGIFTNQDPERNLNCNHLHDPGHLVARVSVRERPRHPADGRCVRLPLGTLWRFVFLGAEGCLAEILAGFSPGAGGFLVLPAAVDLDGIPGRAVRLASRKNLRQTVAGIALAALAGLLLYALVYLISPKGSLPRLA